MRRDRNMNQYRPLRSVLIKAVGKRPAVDMTQRSAGLTGAYREQGERYVEEAFCWKPELEH